MVFDSRAIPRVLKTPHSNPVPLGDSLHDGQRERNKSGTIDGAIRSPTATALFLGSRQSDWQLLGLSNTPWGLGS
jgi:hypothetical protein